MALDKAIKYGKEKRKIYRGAKAVDVTCRNGGSDEYAINNRMHSTRKRELQYSDTIEYEDEGEIE